MGTWMKKIITANGVTEYTPGPHLDKLRKRFEGSGAVMLLLDVSGSMNIKTQGAGRSGQTRLDAAVVGCRGFIEEAVDGGYEAGLVLWNHQIEAAELPTANGLPALSLLNRAAPSGTTSLAPALEFAGQVLLDRDVDDRVIAVFSDGSLHDESESQRVSSQLGVQGVRILTLGLGQESAQSLGLVSTEVSGVPQTTTSMTMSDDIKRMAHGLIRKRK